MLLTIPLCGWLWAFAGAENTSKNWRRLLVGVSITAAALIIRFNIYTFLIIPLMYIATCFGYGIPDSTDTGSTLGRFWFDLFKEGNETRFNHSTMTAFLTNLCTRATVGALYGVALLPLLTIGWVWGGLFVLLNTILWGAYIKCAYTITAFGTKYNIEEFLIGSGVAIGACLALV